MKCSLPLLLLHPGGCVADPAHWVQHVTHNLIRYDLTIRQFFCLFHTSFHILLLSEG